jgi:hypothetical protein
MTRINRQKSIDVSEDPTTPPIIWEDGEEPNAITAYQRRISGFGRHTVLKCFPYRSQATQYYGEGNNFT